MKYLKSKSVSNIIQICIFVAIGLTCILTGINICQQGNYYKISLRPYLKCIPEKQIDIGYGYIRYRYRTENRGKTPAYKVISYSTVTYTEIFPDSTFIAKIKGESNPPVNIIMQKDTIHWYSNKISVSKGDKPASKYEIEQSISEGERKIYVHFYLEFLDVNEKKYFLRRSYLLKPLEGAPLTYACGWSAVFVSEDPIIIKK